MTCTEYNIKSIVFCIESIIEMDDISTAMDCLKKVKEEIDRENLRKIRSTNDLLRGELLQFGRKPKKQ